MGAIDRWIGLGRLAVDRTVVKAMVTDRGQTLLSVLGVAAAIALMLLVTSIGAGLSQSPAVLDGGVDYTIEPESGATSSVVNVEDARLGRVHPVTARLAARPDVRVATPVLLSIMSFRPPEGPPERLLLIGIIPPSDDRTVVGLPTDALTPGDPHYANGSYDGPWTGGAVLSRAAAETLGVAAGDRLSTTGSTDRNFTVQTVSEARRAGIGQFPVAIIHLSELQALTGGSDADLANQLLVDATEDIEDDLARIYPQATVLTRDDLFRGGGSGGNRLPIAISIAALIVSVVVGTLFLMTTLGFELAAERRDRAVLSAIGISGSSRVVLVVLRALVISLLGGLLGIGLWVIGAVATNALATAFLTGTDLAVLRPIFAGYGLGVGLLIALLSLPYLLVLSRRTTTADDLPV